MLTVHLQYTHLTNGVIKLWVNKTCDNQRDQNIQDIGRKKKNEEEERDIRKDRNRITEHRVRV